MHAPPHENAHMLALTHAHTPIIIKIKKKTCFLKGSFEDVFLAFQ